MNSKIAQAMRLFFICQLAIVFSVRLSAQIPGYKAIVSDNAPGGYYFMSPGELSGQKKSYNVILDSLGNVVYYRPFTKDSTTRYFRIQPDGLISYFNTALSRFIIEDSTFNPRDTIYGQNIDSTDAHELLILPNGHCMVIGLEKVVMDLSRYFFFGHGTQGLKYSTAICAVIQELDECKNVVYEWHAKDHFRFDSIDPFYTADPMIVDWSHANALVMDNDGNILMSSRNFNEITKINRKDGSIIWRLGGKYNQFKFTGDTVPFYGQHDIRRLSNGHITLFDDGRHTISHGARALEYELDEIKKTAKLVWSYTYDTAMYSGAQGNVQRLASSATLINYGEINNKNNICFNVVDNKGNEAFKLIFKDKIATYRVFNYPSLPWSLHRPQISCVELKDTLYLDAGSGYSSYQWSNGSTSQRIPVTSPGTYYVFVPHGKGGFISSEKKVVTEIHHSCNSVSASSKESAKDKKTDFNHSH